MSKQSPPPTESPVITLADLGLPHPIRARLDSALDKVSGLLLVTGPPRSGRSCVLRAAARSLASPQLRVAAVEQVIQEPMDGITQVVCRPPMGLSVFQGLRLLEKQRPEILLVDPIEDAAVAELALLSAVNGSLLLGAMPALDSVAALYWLLQLNIEPFLLRTKLLLLQAQRLVRRICPDCRKPVALPRAGSAGSNEMLVRMSGLAHAGGREPTAFAGAGCTRCQGTGFVGSVLVCESLVIGPSLSSALFLAGGPLELLEAALADGMVELSTEAARLVLEGETTLEEAVRALAEPAGQGATVPGPGGDCPSAGFRSPPDARRTTPGAQAPDDDPAAGRVANLVLATAFQEGVSEVQVEPRREEGLVRFRKGGVMFDAMQPPASLRSSLAFHLKRFASLSTDERRLPQLGTAAMRIEGRTTGFSVETVETLHGENVMLRLFPLKPLPALTPEGLGLDESTLDEVRRALKLKSGLVLVAGPSRSGKTSTLYALLRALAAQGRTCFSFEDPIQAEMPGVKQLECRPAEGLTFAAALRTVLPRKPDVILVQELRDRETAELALQAAEQGSLVLSMVLVRQALDGLFRIEEMGIDRGLVARNVALIVAQRLLRKLCEACRRPWRCSRELAVSLGLAEVFARRGEPMAPGAELRLYSLGGCPRCEGRGWKKRELIGQALRLAERTRPGFLAGASIEALQRAAREDGQRTLRDAALEKTLEGVVSLEDALLHTPWDESPAVRGKLLE